jgi:hypothetical protein
MKRMRPFALALRLALAALVAAPAYAGDLTLGARTELWYDDNVVGADGNELSDGELIVTPSAVLSEKLGDVTATLTAKPSYELFFDSKDLRGFNFEGSAGLTWQPSARTTLVVNDSFYRYRNFRLLGTTSGGTTPESGARDLFNRNLAQLQLVHLLSPVDRLMFSGTFALWRFERAGRFDQDTYAASARYERSLSRALSLGAGTSYTRLDIAPSAVLPGRKTDYANLSLVATYAPTERFQVSASAGPTYVRNPKVREFLRADLVRTLGGVPFLLGGVPLVGAVPSTCPTLPSGDFYNGPGCNFTLLLPGSPEYLELVNRALDPLPYLSGRPSRDDVTYFADVTLDREWEAAALTLAYNRDEGSNSAAGFSTVADTVELRGWVRPRRDLTFYGSLIWEDRKEVQIGSQLVTVIAPLAGAVPIPQLVPVGLASLGGGSGKESVESLTAYVRVQLRISERTSIESSVVWRDQSATSGSSFNDFERVLVTLGLNFELEPMRW